MKYLIKDKTDLELLDLFVQTDDAIYCFNLLLRYFYYNINIETKKYTKVLNYNEVNLTDCFEYYRENAEILKNKNTHDHTIYYSLDINSNVELFRHFLNFKWENEGTVLEVGSGFGIYTYLFNLIKEYYNFEFKLVSYDFSEYKINKLKQIGALLKWKNNEYYVADATKPETFDSVKNDNIKLIYSETFSSLGVNRENYNRIMNNIAYCGLSGIIFPNDFIIENDIFKKVKINGKYQSLDGFEIDDRSKEIEKYIKENYDGLFGFRWGLW